AIRQDGGLSEELRRHAAFYVVIAAFFGATWLFAAFQQEPFLPFLVNYVIRAIRGLLLIASLFTLAVALRAIFRARTVPIAVSIGGSFKYARRSPLVSRILFASTVLAVFMAAFLFNKMQIPH